MKRINLFIAIGFMLIMALPYDYANAQPQGQTLSKGAALLFKNVKTKLTTAEKNKMFKDSGIPLSKNKKKLVVDPAMEDELYDVNVYPIDLNSDGKEEIFITQASPFFGRAGQQFTLYIKDDNGSYQDALGVVGIPSILSTSNLGYADLLIGGPGMEQPIWRYNGRTYTLYRRIKDADTQKLNPVEIEAASLAYTSGAASKSEIVKTTEVKEPTTPEIKITDEILSPAAASLFGNVKTKLTNAQKNSITKKSGFVCRDTVIVNGFNKTRIASTLLPTDLNKDSVEEIFISVKTTSFGISSYAYKFYAVDAFGIYQLLLHEVQGSLKIITGTTTGYPDLMTGNPGLEREIWHWNGRAYSFSKKINSLAGLIYKVNSIEAESEKYTSTIATK